ncbi:unnamed protein product, partial [marine sediment metagenome]
DEDVDGSGQSQETGEGEDDDSESPVTTGESEDKKEDDSDDAGDENETEDDSATSDTSDTSDEKEEETEDDSKGTELSSNESSGDETEEKEVEGTEEEDLEDKEDFGPDKPSTTDLNEIESMYSLDSAKKEDAPADLQKAVEDFLEHGTVDITSDVDGYLGGAGGERVRMEMADVDVKKSNSYEFEAKSTARKVARLFEWDKSLRTRYRRGLTEGKINRTRLAKAGVGDYRIFQRKELLVAPDLAVAL